MIEARALSDKAEHGLGTRTFRGVLWSYGSFGGVRLASLITTAVLARLLAPKDFGLIALAMTFMAFLDTLQGLGVGDALVISQPDEVEQEAETAFVLSTGVGLLLWILSAALGPLSASLFHQPRLVEVMPALGFTFLLYGISSTHYALAMKTINFRSRAAAELADAIARGLVGVTLAVAGLGVWSLIGGYIAGTLSLALVLWRTIPWRPRLRPQVRHLRRLLGFGGAITGVGIVGALLNQFDNAVVGRVLGATSLGLYSIANRLPYLLIISLASATGDVLFPAFASLQGDDLRRGFLTSIRYTAVVALPLAAVLITLAAPLTLAVFGPHWRGAVAATQVLCVWALMSPISMVCGNVLKSRGRALLLLLLAIPQAIALIVGSLLLVHQGIVAVAWVQAVIAIVAQIVTLGIVTRMLALAPRRVVAAIGRPAIAASALALILFEIEQNFNDPWLAIITGGILGGAAYIALVHLLMPELLKDLVRMARPGRAAARPEASTTTAVGDGGQPSAPAAPAPTAPFSA